MPAGILAHVSTESWLSQARIFNWQTKYPYDEIVYIEDLLSIDSKQPTLFDKITNVLTKFETLGSRAIKNIHQYSIVAKCGYIISANLNNPAIGSKYLRLKNGHWINRVDGVNMQGYEEKINSIYNLQKYLSKKGIHFVYYQAPDKLCKYDEKYQLPAGVHSLQNTNIDTYTNAFDKFDISYIDFRKTIHAHGFDHYSLFFRTDHHWKCQAGMLAASELETYIRDEFDIDIRDVYEFGEYIPKTYSNAMFGSYGKSVTHHVDKSEDFDIYYPDFFTSFEVVIPDKQLDMTGSFEEVFIDYCLLHN